MSLVVEKSRGLGIRTGETENLHTLIHESISAIHQKYGVDFPCDTCVNSPVACMEEYTRRATLLPSVREETYRIIANQYGPNSDEANAARIVSKIGDDFDAIFLSQLKQKGREPLSWNGYDPEHSQHLAETIEQLLQDPILEEYFRSNPESHAMLTLIKEIASPSRTRTREDAQNELDKLAIVQYKHHKPVILFLLSDWYMHPNRAPDDPIRILEPDCRLILPFPPDQYQVIEAMVNRNIRDLAVFFTTPDWTENPTGIVGIAVMWAGSQVASYTIGEAIDDFGFVFTPNIIKSRNVIEDMFAKAGLVLPNNLETLIFQLFSRHELSHALNKLPDQFLYELSADAPTVVLTLLDALEENDEALSASIALLLGEYQMYAKDPTNGEETNDGYRISCLVILNKLFEYHLVEEGEGGRIHIHQDRAQCRRLIEDLTQLHRRVTAHDEETIDILLAIEPSPEVRRFLESSHLEARPPTKI